VSWVGVAGFEPAASSSRSQVVLWAARTGACLTWQTPSADVRWRPWWFAVIVTQLVTRPHTNSDNTVAGSGSSLRSANASIPVASRAHRVQTATDGGE